MDWVRLHLLVNHFPIILIVTGSLAVIAAAVGRRRTLWSYAAVTVLLAAVTAPAAYVSGLQAEETVEEAWWADEASIEEHEELGLWALIALLAAGASAAVALRRPRRTPRVILGVVTLGAATLTGLTALEGGEIVHDSPVLEADRPPPGPETSGERPPGSPGTTAARPAPVPDASREAADTVDANPGGR